MLKISHTISTFFAKCQSAETLIEVVIAIGIISTGAATAANVAVQSIRSSAFARDALVAQNLAMEGLEIVRNVRDTNWIKFSFDRPGCWNQLPTRTACENSAANTLVAGSYVITHGGLEKTAENFDSTNLSNANNANYQLFYYDLDDSTNSNNDTDAANDRDIILNQSTVSSPIVEVAPTKFYREINIGYANMDENTGLITLAGTPANLMLVSSTVYWNDGGRIANASSSNILSNDR